MASFALAEHLEDFVLLCIDVVTSAKSSRWDTPYEFSFEGADPIWLKSIPPWPDLVDWRLVGFSLAVDASNTRRRVLWDLDMIRGISDYWDPEACHSASAEAAAKRGMEAWALAVKVRELNGLAPLEWPDDTDGPEVFAGFIERAEKARAEALKSVREIETPDKPGA